MFKNILKLEGTQRLTKNEQRGITGGVLGSQCFQECSPADCAGSCVVFYCSPGSGGQFNYDRTTVCITLGIQ